jgi:hypothetical protein
MTALDVLSWPGFNQAFIVSFAGAILLSLAVIPYGKRRPVGAPLSWGEAMIGGTYMFGVLFLAFGIVPHQWISHADRELGWSKDKLLIGWGGFLEPEAQGGWFPLTLQYEAVRDTVVVILHLIFFGLFIWLAIWWQKRGEVKQKELPTSTYGRPLVRQV